MVGDRQAAPHSGPQPTRSLGVDVDDGRLQFRMLEGQHPRQPAKSGLRQRDSITRLELLRAPRDDPQPWAVPRAHSRQRLHDVGDRAACATAPVPAASNPASASSTGRGGHTTTIPFHDDVLARQRVPKLQPCRARPRQLDDARCARAARTAQRLSSGSSAAASPTSSIAASRTPACRGPTASHSSVNKRLVNSIRGCAGLQQRHLDLVDLQQDLPVGTGERHLAERTGRGRKWPPARRSRGRPSVTSP